MFSVKKTTITLTRGDTLKVQLNLVDTEGNEYVPEEGDKIRFAMKEDYNDPETLIYADIPTDTLILTLDPGDTKSLSFGKYVYDIQLTKANGDVDTVINKGSFVLTEEVE